MTEEDWEHAILGGFCKKEKWGDPFKMSKELIFKLIKLRSMLIVKYPQIKIIIHCGYEYRDTGGYHPKGMAVDIHASGINLIDFYLIAEKSDLFGGIGIYPKWNNPGLHLDIGTSGRRWTCFEKGIYESLNTLNLRRIICA